MPAVTSTLLEGIRVLDFGRYIAGPFCAALLADLGADVIRVEKVAGSEDRFIVPLRRDGDGGALYLQVNRSKRGMTLDPMKPQATEIVRRLVATADVVVANLPVPSLEAMGLDYPALAAVKPEIILTTVNAFGTSGPWSDRLGFDGIGQAMSGAAYLSGHPDEPMKSYVQWVDFTAASFAAFGTLAALMQRSRSGRGQHVEASLLGSALTVANSVLMEESVLGTGRIASGNRAASCSAGGHLCDQRRLDHRPSGRAAVVPASRPPHRSPAVAGRRSVCDGCLQRRPQGRAVRGGRRVVSQPHHGRCARCDGRRGGTGRTGAVTA